MKNIKYIVFSFIFFLFNIFYVDASCTNEEIESLKELAKDIEITYKHKGIYEIDNEYVDYYSFDIIVKNISDEFRVMYNYDTEELEVNNGISNLILSNGNWNFSVYSKRCDEKVYDIQFFLPRFNVYSLDPLCEGIDGNDFALCGKYYEYDVEYDDFVKRINNYRSTLKDNSVDNVAEDKTNINIDIIINSLLNFITNYRLYIVITLVTILVILITIIIFKRKKRRGVLE